MPHHHHSKKSFEPISCHLKVELRHYNLAAKMRIKHKVALRRKFSFHGKTHEKRRKEIHFHVSLPLFALFSP